MYATFVNKILPMIKFFRFILDSTLAVVDGFSKKMDVVEYIVSLHRVNIQIHFFWCKLILFYNKGLKGLNIL